MSIYNDKSALGLLESESFDDKKRIFEGVYGGDNWMRFRAFG